MTLYGDDLYIIKTQHILDLDELESITSLYQPLLSKNALCLFINLCKMPETSTGVIKHLDLCEKMNCSIDEVYAARLELEDLFLLRSYAQKINKTNSLYYYYLQKPKTLQQFLKHDVLSRMLANRMGIDYVNQLCERLNEDPLVGFNEVTDKLKIDYSKWNKNKEEQFSAIKKQLPKNDDNSKSYDFKHYLELIDESEIRFPWRSISDDDFVIINDLGNRFKVEYGNMMIVLNKALNRATKTIDSTNLMNSIYKYSEVELKATVKDDPLEYAYTIHPKGKITEKERQAILAIKEEFASVSNEVINNAIEASINNTDEHHIVKTYVEKVISSTLDNKEKDSEKKVITTYKTKSGKTRRNESIPEYKQTDDDVEIITDDMISANLEALKSLKKKG